MYLDLFQARPGVPCALVHLQSTLTCPDQHFTTNLKFPLQKSRWLVCIEAVYYIDGFYLSLKYSIAILETNLGNRIKYITKSR